MVSFVRSLLSQVIAKLGIEIDHAVLPAIDWQLVFGLLLVSVLWGCTTPFIRLAAAQRARDERPGSRKNVSRGASTSKSRRGSFDHAAPDESNERARMLKISNSDEQKQENDSREQEPVVFTFRELLRILLDIRFYVPYVLNQTGSLVYYFLLADYDVALMVPAANGLALVATTGTEIFLEEYSQGQLLPLRTKKISTRSTSTQKSSPGTGRVRSKAEGSEATIAAGARRSRKMNWKRQLLGVTCILCGFTLCCIFGAVGGTKTTNLTLKREQ
ncbi:unnamed protein product [Amoebophrya sp. A25]|nr:unnamed protein product [Amoebophrya sp. A25]|eukprot:GSA25T00015781001.1